MDNGVRWTALAALILVSCAHVDAATRMASPTAGPVEASLARLTADELRGYVVRDAVLDDAAVSADAIDGSSLERLLRGAGFQTGTERRFTAQHRRLTEVVARVLRFGSADGAETYVSWLGAHGVDLLGTRTQPAAAPELPDAVAFTHGISGCCTKDTFQYFVAWARGTYAITLRVGGPAAGPQTAAPLARQLDTRVSKEV